MDQVGGHVFIQAVNICFSEQNSSFHVLRSWRGSTPPTPPNPSKDPYCCHLRPEHDGTNCGAGSTLHLSKLGIPHQSLHTPTHPVWKARIRTGLANRNPCLPGRTATGAPPACATGPSRQAKAPRSSLRVRRRCSR